MPIWLGYQGPQGARRAGMLGESLLTASAASWGPYRDGLVEGGHDPAIARMAGGVLAWITDDPEADWPVVSKHVGYQLDSYRRHMIQGTDQPTPKPVDPAKLRQRDVGSVLGYFLHATPEEAAKRIQDYAGDAPVESIFIFVSIGGMAESLVARHVQTVCTRLGPLLAHT